MTLQIHFTKDTLPPPEAFSLHRRKVLTQMMWIVHPFSYETREGTITIYPNGYRALDSGGRPYPIAAEEYDRMYEPARSIIEQQENGK